MSISLSEDVLKAHDDQYSRRTWRIEIYTLSGTRVGVPGVGQSYDYLLSFPTDYPVCDLLRSPFWVKEVAMHEQGTVWEGRGGNVKVAALEWQPKAFILAGGLTVDAQVNLPIGYGSTIDNRIVHVVNSEPAYNSLDVNERLKWLECMESFEISCMTYTPGIKATDEELVMRVTKGYDLAVPPNDYQATILWILKPAAPYFSDLQRENVPIRRREATLFTRITHRAREAFQGIKTDNPTNNVTDKLNWEKETRQGVLDAASNIPAPRRVLTKELSKRLWLTDIGEFLPKEAITILCGLQRAGMRPYVNSTQHKEYQWREFNKLLLVVSSAVKENHI